MTDIDKPTWKWGRESSLPGAQPRMGHIGSEPLGDGSRFVVFGGTDALYYGSCDEKTGDPFFPGPFVVEGGDFPDEATVERIGTALFRAWAMGLRDGAGAEARAALIAERGLKVTVVDGGAKVGDGT